MNQLAFSIFSRPNPQGFGDMNDVYNYFTRSEELIEICNKMMMSYTFHGGISITINDEFMDTYDVAKKTKRKIKIFLNGSEQVKNDLDAVLSAKADPKNSLKKKLKYFNEEFSTELINVLKKGENWRKMFGFCPIKIYHDNQLGRKKIVVPGFGSGVFQKQYDRTSDQYYVTFTPNDGILPGEDYHVFTWTGKEPCAIFDYVSEIKKLWEDWYFIRETKKNFLQADHDNAYQTIVTVNTNKTPNVDIMTARDVTSQSITHQDQLELHQSDVDRIARQTQISNFQNKKRQHDEVERYDPSTGKLKVKRANSIRSGDIYNMPAGETIANVPVPKIRNAADLIEFEMHYQNMVCLTMGIPYNFVSNNRTFKNDQSQEQKAIFRRVLDIRECVIEFFAFISSKLFGGESANMINYIVTKLEAEKTAKKEVLAMKEKFIQSEEEWNRLFTDLELPGFAQIAREMGAVADRVITESSSNINNFSKISDSEKTVQRTKILNKGFSEYVSQQIELDFDRRANELKILSKRVVFKLEFKNLPYLAFEQLTEIQFAESRGALTVEEMISTLRNRIGIETDQETLDKLTKEREKQIKEEAIATEGKKPAEGVATSAIPKQDNPNKKIEDRKEVKKDSTEEKKSKKKKTSNKESKKDK
jgi:hypothetical protein